MIDLNPLINTVHDRFFCPATGLLYDYLTSAIPERRFQYLPTVQEVAFDYPNPCGWGTGMEDCMLNAGLMLDVLSRHPNPLWRDQLIQGMRACATVHGRPGFLARGRSPLAPDLTYSNTSRDQITLAVYGLFRHYRTSTAAAHLLQAIAQDCLKQVNPEHHYNLRRLDGQPAFCCDMWKCQCHEALRLPMVYAAAYRAGGRPEFLQAAQRLMPEAMDKTLAFDNLDAWWDLPTMQMQASIQTLLDTDLFPDFRNQLLQARNTVAEVAQQRLPEAIRHAEQWEGPWNEPMGDWRTLPLQPHRDTAGEQTTRSEICGGKSYLVPMKPDTFKTPAERLRACGCWLMVQVLGEIPVQEALRQRMHKLMDRLELTQSCSDSLMKLIAGLSLLQD